MNKRSALQMLNQVASAARTAKGIYISENPQSLYEQDGQPNDTILYFQDIIDYIGGATQNPEGLNQAAQDSIEYNKTHAINTVLFYPAGANILSSLGITPKEFAEAIMLTDYEIPTSRLLREFDSGSTSPDTLYNGMEDFLATLIVRGDESLVKQHMKSFVQSIHNLARNSAIAIKYGEPIVEGETVEEPSSLIARIKQKADHHPEKTGRYEVANIKIWKSVCRLINREIDKYFAPIEKPNPTHTDVSSAQQSDRGQQLAQTSH